jgi:hypothetical protein
MIANICNRSEICLCYIYSQLMFPTHNIDRNMFLKGFTNNHYCFNLNNTALWQCLLSYI